MLFWGLLCDLMQVAKFSLSMWALEKLPGNKKEMDWVQRAGGTTHLYHHLMVLSMPRKCFQTVIPRLCLTLAKALAQTLCCHVQAGVPLLCQGAHILLALGCEALEWFTSKLPFCCSFSESLGAPLSVVKLSCRISQGQSSNQ